MNTIWFYLAAFVLYGLGTFCIRNTSPFTRAGGAKYLRREKRRLVGKILLILAILSLVIGLISQILSAQI
jgi:hypothetical protein